MPGGDGTGPTGQGPMTGRGAGFCAGYSVGGYANPLPRRGMGFGRGRGIGRGRGFRRMAFAQVTPVDRIVPVYPAQQPTKEQEKQYLENEVKSIEVEEDALKQELETVKKRLAELKKK
jgi:hypothetical protein